MPLAEGFRVGPYEVVGAIGAGGMGEVYRARDGRLGRDVAIKILPESFSIDPERLSRFDREARTLASLNHPNIGAIYGLEDAGGVRALVLELVEGQTLAERLQRGAIPPEAALPLARQMALALEAAHANGVVHRDLKPANIKVRPDGTLKILDFGLAKALACESVPPLSVPTITIGETRPGTVLGTPAYMSPEQARALPIDARTDVWAFGCVLYEMLTGRRAFTGNTISDVLARVLEREPDYHALPSSTPPAIRRLLGRCLAKNPANRLHAIADARLEIEDALAPDTQRDPDETVTAAPIAAPGRAWTVHAAWGVVAVGLASLLLLNSRNDDQPSADPQVVTMTVAPPRGATFPQGDSGGWPAISPDGRRLAFVAIGANGGQRLWIRRMDSTTARGLEGTDGATRPFWSPDGQSLGYFANGQLARVDVDTGVVQVLADAPYLGGLAGTWGDGTIVWKGAEGFRRVPADGSGAATVILSDADENNPVVPTFLPDGRRFLYTLLAPREEDSRVCVRSLESSDARCFLNANAPVRYASGYLLLVRNGTLVAQRFDAAGLGTSGEAVPVASEVASAPAYAPPAFSVSTTGVLVYAEERIAQPLLAWIDRSGKPLETAPIAGTNPDLSRDGKRLLVQRRDQQTDNFDVWLIEPGANTETLFAFDRETEYSGAFSPGGDRVVYASLRGPGDPVLVIRPTIGQGAAETLSVSGNSPDWSPAGDFVLYQTSGDRTRPGINFDLLAFRVHGDRTPFPVAQTEYGERSGRFYPGDGSWISYDSTESGRREIWLQRFMDPTGASRRRVSTNGGVNAEWRSDGRELFYVAADGTMMAVPITQNGTALEWGSPRGLFKTSSAGGTYVNYAVSPDGQRLLVPVPPDPGDTAPIAIVVNWQATMPR